jgi:hypothetical protein
MGGGFPWAGLVLAGAGGATLFGRLPPIRQAVGQHGTNQVREADEEKWWRRTAVIAGTTVAVVAFLCLLPVVTPGSFGQGPAFGLPLAAFLATTVAPLLVLVAIFVFAGRQLALDRRHDMSDR